MQRWNCVSLSVTLLMIGILVLAGCKAPTLGEIPVEPPLGEVLIAFTADHVDLEPGECTALHWNVRGGLGRELSGRPVGRFGQVEVCPKETTVYWLNVDAGTKVERREIVISVKGTVRSPADVEVTVHRDLAYASYELDSVERGLFLDLYLPERIGSQPLPLLIYIHGGGWIEGSSDARIL